MWVINWVVGYVFTAVVETLVFNVSALSIYLPIIVFFEDEPAINKFFDDYYYYYLMVDDYLDFLQSCSEYATCLIVNNIYIYAVCVEYFIIQCVMLYILVLMLLNNQLYYSLFYLFCQVIFFGVVLSISQVELFTGFLWTVEYVVIFVFLIMLFYVNAQGDAKKYNLYVNKNPQFIMLVLFVFICPTYLCCNFKFLDTFNFITFYDNFYEAYKNKQMNDFLSLYISYYLCNSFVYILIAFLLFFGSLACIYLFYLNRSLKLKNYNKFLKDLDFSQTFSHCYFMRKQYLHKQQKNPSVKSFTATEDELQKEGKASPFGEKKPNYTNIVKKTAFSRKIDPAKSFIDKTVDTTNADAAKADATNADATNVDATNVDVK